MDSVGEAIIALVFSHAEDRMCSDLKELPESGRTIIVHAWRQKLQAKYALGKRKDGSSFF